MWQDAIVRVTVGLLEGEVMTVQGLVVAPDGKVLTILEPEANIAWISVDIPGRGAFPARLTAYDPTADAALLSIDAQGLVSAPMFPVDALPDSVSVVIQSPSGSLRTGETLAKPSTNAPDRLFALQRDESFYGHRGAVVVTQDGAPLGLTLPPEIWLGTAYPCLGCFDTAVPAVFLSTLVKLLDPQAPNISAVPTGISFHGGDWTSAIDSPALREAIALPVQRALSNLGEDVRVDGLGGEAYKIIGASTPNGQNGTVLELLYREPQTLIHADGRVLGYGRYIVFLQGDPGPSGIVLCGVDSKHLGGAFFSQDGFSAVNAVMEERPPSSINYVVVATPFPFRR